MTELQLPPEFEVTNDYDSHRPMLWMALETLPPGKYIEFGCGYGSSMQIEYACRRLNKICVCYETNDDWAHTINSLDKDCYGLVETVPSYSGIDFPLPRHPAQMLFIDSAPGEERAELVEEYRNKALILIVHDTEPGAEHVYHIQEVLNSFPYRCDLIVPGHPQTTAVSMTYDFADWKGITINNYQFI